MPIDMTDLASYANMSTSDFNNSYLGGPGVFAGGLYYNTLAAKADDSGLPAVKAYALRQKGIADQSDARGEVENAFTERMGIYLEKDLSVGSVDALRVIHERIKADYNARAESVANGGTGSLSADETLDLLEVAATNAGVKPNVFFEYTPLRNVSYYEPDRAEEMFTTLNAAPVGGPLASTASFIDEAVPVSKQLGYGVGEDYIEAAKWIKETKESIGEVSDRYSPGTFDEIEEQYGTLQDILTNFGATGPFAKWIKDTADFKALYKVLENFIEELKDWFGGAEERRSPLVLDLDDSGTIELVSLANSTTWWDMDQDGFAEKTGWVTGGDGLLALDKDHNGQIDGGELFGTMTTDGFTILAEYDSNNDGAITEGDTVWDDLIVWRDDNENGGSEWTELHALADFDIVSINLNATEVSQTNQGHAVTHTSTFVVNDGVNPADTRIVHDVWFSFDNVNTVYSEAYTPDFGAAYLPTLRGYGTLPSLHIAESFDNSGTGNLQGLLDTLDGKTFSQLFDATATIPDLVKSILFRWAGVDGVSPMARGAFIDARELGFLEKLVGEPFVQRGVYANPQGFEAGYDLQQAFRIAFNNMYGRLLAQAAGSELFTGTPVYNIAADKFEGITGLNSTKLSELQTEAAGLANSAARHAFWANVVRMVDFAIDLDHSSYSAAKSALAAAIDASDSVDTTVILGVDSYGEETGIRADVAFRRPVGDTATGTAGADTLNGSASDDTLSGANGNDALNGFAGNDTLRGGNDNDTLTGGTGGDFLKGEQGDDTYKYSRGDGDDTIEENGTVDENTIEFQAGISLAHLTLTRMGNQDLVIDIAGGGRIVVNDQFNNFGRVETLSFADGTPAWDILAHSYEAWGTAGKDVIDGIYSGSSGNQDDTIHGGDGNDALDGLNGNDALYGDAGDDDLDGGNGDDTIYGGDGNDDLAGNNGNDILWGGEGDDTVYGFADNDTYHYEGGRDYYYDGTGTSDGIVLDARWDSVAPRYQFVKSPDGNSNNLLIWFDDRNTIQIEDWTASLPLIETMTFANGTVVNLASVSPVGLSTVANSSANTIAGTTGADVIYGFGGNDALNGTGTDGNDNLYGGTGDDTLKGGNGDDWLQGDAGNDTLQGGADNDTYFFTGGLDEITEGGGASDTLKLLAGPTLESITLSDSGNNRTVVVGAGVNEIKIVDHLNASDTAKRIEYLELGDGFRINLVGATPWTSVTGNNSWTGTTGADSAVAGSGNNNLSGGDGNDMLYGGGGADYVTGGTGVDYLHGGSGDDPSVRGGDGDDFLWGGDGNDVLDGENDNDTLWGGAGVNRLEGGDGDDILWGGDAGTAAAPEQLRGEAGRDTIHGGNGVDETLGGGGDDTIYGNGGDDELFGGAGDDEIHGGAGNDLIRGEEGRDDLYGDEGHDDVRGGLDDNVLHGGDGDDVLWGGYNSGDTFYGNDTLYGDAGNDTLNGALGDDTLDGGAGNDSQYGAGGSDSYVFSGGADYVQDTGGTTDRLLLGTGLDLNDVAFLVDPNDGNDLIVAAFGRSVTIEDQAVANSTVIEQIVMDDGFYVNSSVYTGWTKGTSGNDTNGGAGVNGGSGINVMLGYAGNDIFNGLANNDFLHGGDGIDTLNGGDDNDMLHGGRDNDILNGGSGNDTLWGGDGNDELNGGDNDDIYVLTAGTDTITETGGTDTIRFRGGLLPENLTFTKDSPSTNDLTIASALGTFVLKNQLGSAGGRVDTLLFEDGFQLNVGIYGSDEWLQATTDAQTLTGDHGNGSGINTDDVIIGGTGSNSTRGHDGNDQIYAGAGNDSSVQGDAGIDLIHGGSGNDTLYGGTGTDTMWGGTGADTVRGGDDADTIRGGDGDDGALWGENGDDTVYGDAGNDTIRGDAGNDTLRGGDGDDTIYGASNSTDSTDNDTLYGEGGDDHLFGQSGDDTLYGGFNADELRGGAGTDTLWGESGEDELYGDAGADTLHGGDGNDVLYGAGGSDSTDNDVLYGDDGDDFLYGQSGNDTLVGGLGADNLQGDAGADTYVWAAGTGDDGDGVDSVIGFTTAQGDVIDISDLLVGYNPVSSAITDFVRITGSGVNTYVLDVDADGTASASSWVKVGVLKNVTTDITDEAALLTNGNLLAA